jgi:DNA-binding MarR family transcriptional regulator
MQTDCGPPVRLSTSIAGFSIGDTICRMAQTEKPYRLDGQIGFLIRKAMQRHLVIFADTLAGLTNTQFAALARLHELGPLSQNHLGRATAMDGATIKGVVGRLMAQGWVETRPDPEDRRRLTVSLTPQGAALAEQSISLAQQISDRTLEPLDPQERDTLLALLSRLT